MLFFIMTHMSHLIVVFTLFTHFIIMHVLYCFAQALELQFLHRTNNFLIHSTDYASMHNW